jgi:hypothetical protein
MGFLDRFKGGDATVTVALETAEITPGGEVVVRYDVGGELDDKCRAIRVGITCDGKYLVTERDRDADGDVTTREVWRSIELHEEAHDYPVNLGPGQATFTVPAGAAPHSQDAVEWTAWARVDREKGMDRVERVTLPVRLPADAAPAARTMTPSNDGLTIEGVPMAIRAGDQISGTLNINPTDDAKVQAVRMRLHRRCTYVADTINGYGGYGSNNSLFGLVIGGGTSHITREDKIVEVDLDGKREFSAGAAEQIPFTVPVPDNAGPSTAHPHAQVEWRLEAVLDRRMRGDLDVEVPIVVL